MSYAETYDPEGGIAIIGMAGRFPGAKNLDEFWCNLQAGTESISYFVADELEPSRLELPAVRQDPHYVRARGILDSVDMFDAAFFSVPPHEASIMDPQQRLFLETSWTALENAGYDPASFSGSIGVWAGMSNNTYFLENVFAHRDLIERVGTLQTMMGNEKDYLATRVSYKLNLRGPSISVHTACSTSLVAVCQAYQGLLSYQCDMALAGGVSITLPQKRGYLYHEGTISSPDGHCRAFDERAQGTVFSNGLAIVVLKRLSEALADGDHIYAVIKGAALNNDGSAKVSFTAPSVDGQAEAIVMAQAVAGIDPETISYVEAHGTATPLGDPIEIAALTQAFRTRTALAGFCAIGSVKTNIGHLDVAAGIAGLVKTALALKHKVLPPSLHFTTPNPKLDLTNSPFYVNTTLQEWPAGSTPRRAGVSSFGVGGTNAHVVIEEVPSSEPTKPVLTEQLLILSARTPNALDQRTENLLAYFLDNPQANLADVAYTLQVGRRAFPHRRILICRNLADAISMLQTRDAKRIVTACHDGSEPSVTFMFPGQGAQYVNMGVGLYHTEPFFKSQVDECAEVLAPHLGLDIRSVLYPDVLERAALERQLAQTFITQPALFVIEYALAQLWMRWGIKPQAMIGHSLGEYVAACLAGVFSRDDALVLVAGRAQLIQSLPSGAMLAVQLPAVEVKPFLDGELSLAAVNTPTRTVVSGPSERIKVLREELELQQIACRELSTSHAFHSQMMDPILQPFADLVQRVPMQPPQIPWVSSLTGDWISASQVMDPDYWVQQLRQPVRFADGVHMLLQNAHQALLEVGPGQTLSALAQKHPDRVKEQLVLPSLSSSRDERLDRESMLNALGHLWLTGVSVDWLGVHDKERRRRVPLPTYPFERKRFWLDSLPVEERSLNTEDSRVRRGEDQEVPVTKELLHAPNTQHKEMSMDEQLNASVPSPDDGHRKSLLSKLQQLFSDISGIDPTELDTAVPFLELGFDSLSLTQVSTAIQKTFGVKVTFRQLLEEVSSLNALATRIAQLLPPDKGAANVRPAGSHEVRKELSASQSHAVSLSNNSHYPELLAKEEVGTRDAGALERIFAKQLELMARQLDMLQKGHTDTQLLPSIEGKTAPHTEPTWAVSDAVSTSPNNSHTKQVTQPVKQKAEPATQAFGPYKPVEKGTSGGGGLTVQQQQHLDALIAHYTARTRESKRLTQLHRPHLADPRSVAGFRLLWKDLVYPIVTTRSGGAKLWDVDGNEYIDLTNGFGMILFGHSPPFVTTVLEEQLKHGIEIGPQSPLAGQVAELLCEFTGMERAAFCNTGSEAVLAALRIARTVTGRDKIALFSGAYHGIFDEVLVRSTMTNGVPRSYPIAPGIPASMVENVLILDYGSPAALELLRTQAHELAAVLVEPVQSRRPDLQPREFVHELRALTAKSSIALIFDEVVTGFRVHPGGAQAVFGIQADLATYGKVIGGGLPIGVVAGKAAFMDALDGGMWQYGDASSPEIGVTFFAGTFVRHPLALTAAWAVLNHLREHGPGLQRELNQRTTHLVETLTAHAERVQAPIRIEHFSSFFCFNFSPDLPYASLFFAHMRNKGMHIWEGRPCFLTTAHTDEDLDRVIQAFKESVTEMQEAGFLPGSSYEQSPLPGARLGKDRQGNPAWFVPDPDRPGKYLQVGETR